MNADSATGAGPCQLTPEGELMQAPHPWTDMTNLLVLDMPLGSGWSYAKDPDSVASDSAWAAGEVDDVLQVCSDPRFQRLIGTVLNCQLFFQHFPRFQQYV